jgi:phospholipase/lecithinase/hemolysin
MVRLEERKAPLRLVSSTHTPISSITQLTTASSGDSYTQTGFDVNGTQPNPANPLGNPPYPGYTSSNGPNWVDFLTTTYNASALLTYNLAYGGATVDSHLVTPYAPTVLSLSDQVTSEFLPKYGSHPSFAPWTSSSSLFAFFIGINDVGNSWSLNNSTLYSTIFTEYEDLLDAVYDTGARNFLFLSVPPVNRAPLTLNKDDGGYAEENEGKVILDWNKRLVDMTTRFKRKNAGIRVFVHDTWGLFERVIKNPRVYEQTKGYKNVTGYCEAYMKYVSPFPLQYQLLPCRSPRNSPCYYGLSCTTHLDVI